MPHGGGGGHSGGGFHGGSSFGGSHGGGSSGPRFSDRPFHGGRPYIYYRHCVPFVVYSDINPSTKKPSIVIPLVVLGIMAAIAPAIMCADAYHNPTKNTAVHEEIAVIDDKQDYLTDAEEIELKSIFEDFNAKTGVMPALVTVEHKYYLEEYAYDYYVSNWNDESHWLIAYCASDDSPKSNWAFEICQGYDTDDILYDSMKERYFGTVLCDALDGDYTVGASFIKAFNTLLPETLKEEFYVAAEPLVFCIIWEAVIGLFTWGVIHTYRKEKAMQTAEEVPEGTKIEAKKCPNCGTTYYKGITDHCRKCGRSFLDDEFDGI